MAGNYVDVVDDDGVDDEGNGSRTTKRRRRHYIVDRRPAAAAATCFAEDMRDVCMELRSFRNTTSSQSEHEIDPINNQQRQQKNNNFRQPVTKILSRPLRLLTS
jgi:hypothetical protein